MYFINTPWFTSWNNGLGWVLIELTEQAATSTPHTRYEMEMFLYGAAVQFFYVEDIVELTLLDGRGPIVIVEKVACDELDDTSHLGYRMSSTALMQSSVNPCAR